MSDFFDFLRSAFTVLLAVDGSTYLDIHDESERYICMDHHIIHMRFGNRVAAFDEERLALFRSTCRRGFAA